MIRELLHCQTYDPGRGSFMVNDQPVKKPNGKAKYKRCADGNERPVYRSCHHVETGKHGSTSVAHPDAFEFVEL